MRFVLLLSCLVGLASGQTLRVKSANAKSIELAWTGDTGPVDVERLTAAAPQKLATTSQDHYEDTTIDRYGAYRYRISAGGHTSNVVIAGAPPAGVQNVAPVPKDVDPAKYGPATAIAMDENGDPVIAFEWVDPNGDNDASDSEIRFVRWDRAAYKWTLPVKVQTVGDIPSQNLNPVSIGCDPQSGVLAIATPISDKGAMILTSKDHGATWSGAPVAGIAATVSATAVALAGSKLHAVITSSEGGTNYTTGPVDDPASWKMERLPAGAGWKQPHDVNVGLALPPSAPPVIAWYETQEDGEGRRFQLWRPGGKVSTVFESKRDASNLALAAGGGKLGLLMGMLLNEKDDEHGVWYTQSTDGVTWSKPSMLPIDGPRSTNPPLDVTLDSRGRIVAVFGANSGTDTTGCNFPALSRSNDGTQWKTCGPGKAEGGNFGPQPATLHAIEAGNDKVYVLWQEQAENKFKQGVLLWHEH
ncbi:MAG TPA: hypothetical protein VG456_11250 [Candidatus Sulfopaludibacter sp.]|jgi:hypothetical protein|nr:hypothetical protein [Candidatus Sulfopaludibacter sp.]